MLELNHIGLVVKDIDRSMNFYTNILGFSIGDYKADENLKLLLLHNKTITIELIERSSDPMTPRKAGYWDHLTFQVKDIYWALEMLKAQKVELIDIEPRESLLGRKVLFFLGPDGERIEFIEK